MEFNIFIKADKQFLLFFYLILTYILINKFFHCMYF